ncbi:MAG: glycosyltransferase family 2 protein [Candidatus Omnitrophota bacterium]|jgi:glycosyltransferase involved in cell wall biosynthesis
MASISIIIPCRNEERFIAKCLDSVIAQEYPKDDLEVLVIDGMSQDGTKDIISRYSQKYPLIRLFNNPRRTTPFALNLGINNSKGEYIFWMSAHNTYEDDYLAKCVKYINEYQADNVGGIMVTLPRDNTLTAKVIAKVISDPFGVGNSTFRTGAGKPTWVDTVFGGCYRREVFKKIGLFNERLTRGQDMEFNLRLKNAGLRTLLVPEIVSYYYARSDIKSFIAHNFSNGRWAILPFMYSKIIPVSARHLVPLLFVLSLFITGCLGFFHPQARPLFACILGSYLLLDALFSIRLCIKEKSIACLFLAPLLFPALHISYGLGSLLGMFNCLFSIELWKRIRNGT